jgi:hypothetical protein
MFLSIVTKPKTGSEISAPFMSFSQRGLSGGSISALIEKPPIFQVFLRGGERFFRRLNESRRQIAYLNASRIGRITFLKGSWPWPESSRVDPHRSSTQRRAPCRSQLQHLAGHGRSTASAPQLAAQPRSR